MTSVERQVIRDLLAADEAVAVEDEWVNECKVCKTEHPHAMCPGWCRGRENFAWKRDEANMFDLKAVRIDAGDCACQICAMYKRGSKRILPWYWTSKNRCSLPRCLALRGRKIEKLAFRCARTVDEQLCKACFANCYFKMGLLSVRLLGTEYIVVFRSTEYSFGAMLATSTARPSHYIHSLEEGQERSFHEMACLHIGRHWACHGEGRPYECLSTSAMISEAVRRLAPGRKLEAILVPQEMGQSCV